MAGTILTPFKRRTPIGTGDASTGTWTRVSNSGNPYITKATTAELSKISTALPLESFATETGCQLNGIDILIRVTTANLVSAPTLTVYRRNTSLANVGGTVNITTSTVAGTLTGATVTAAATDRLLKWVPTTPAIDYAKDSKADYSFELTLRTATTTATRVYNAITYYSVPD